MFPTADLIFDTSSYAAIRKGVSSLRQTIAKRKSDLTSLSSQAKVFESDKIKKSMAVERLSSEISNLRSFYSRYERVRLALRDQSLRTDQELKRTTALLKRREHSSEILQSKIEEKEQRINDSTYTKLGYRATELEASRSDLLLALEKVSIETTETSAEFTRKKAEIEHNLKPQLKNLEDEESKRVEELDAKKRWVEQAQGILPQMEKDLFGLTQEETKLDVDSRRSKEVLQQFEDNAKQLRREKETASRSMTGLEKRIISIKKGLENQAEIEETLHGQLSSYGHSTPPESFDGVETIKDELEKEYEALRGDVNLLADKNYREIYVGYKGMSERKNQLEGERNAIVNFIESIDAEKKKAFLDAFEKIDRELRDIFTKLTNGSAWLELENPDDVFNSGVLLMAQFPNKIARESSIVSGGEKTVSALSLILAIQAVNPAPFYIFDEIDAHLDAVNSDRLADLLKERADRSQIVIVSLKDSILSRADAMYGVYMEKGLSKTLKYQPRIEVQNRSG
jgi:chromosome segregation protein